MRIGITFDLKSSDLFPAHVPDDFEEEFDSPATIEAIAQVLRGLGHEVVKLGNGHQMLQRLLNDPPDFVFNFAEGQGIGRAREARVPAVLEMLGIPYSGSDPLTLATTLDKDCARRLAAAAGIPVPRGVVLAADKRTSDTERLLADVDFYPVIVKPAWEGSSKGIRNRCLVDQPALLPEIIEEMWRDYQQPLLVEEYIEGDELTVGILGNSSGPGTAGCGSRVGAWGNGRAEVLGIMRILPLRPMNRFVYSLEVKRDYLRQVRYECPAALSAEDADTVRQAALRSYQILGCRDVARIDFRLRDGIPYFLEVNPLPGLNPESSDLVIMARLVGWTYERLIENIVKAAFHRQGIIAEGGR